MKSEWKSIKNNSMKSNLIKIKFEIYFEKKNN